MNRDKMINLAIGGGIALVLVFGWLIGVSPILAQSATAQATEAAMVTANQTSETRLVLLKKQFGNMGELQTQLTGLRLSIPATADIPTFLSEINAQSAASGVSLTSLTVNDAAYVAVTPAAPAPAATVGASASPSPSPSASAAATPATTTAPATGSGLVAIPVVIIVSGPYAAVMNFSGAVQVGSRLFYVASLTVSGSSLDPSFTGTLTGNVYVLPSTDTTTTTGSTATPTPTQTPTPTSTPTPSISGSAKPTGSPTPTGTAKP